MNRILEGDPIKWLILLLLLLAGCPTRAPTTQEVKISVYTPCVKSLPAKSDFKGPKVAPDASNGDKVLAIARDTPRHDALIEGCR